MKNKILGAIRFTVSIGLLLYLVHIANIDKIVNLVKEINIHYVLLALVIFIISVFFLTLRWKLLTHTYGMNTDFLNLFIYYLIGLFFNNFLPTSIGGDLSRAYYLGRQSKDKAGSFGTVLLERFLGLVSTLSLALISMFWVLQLFPSKRILYVTFILMIIVGGFGVLIFNPRLFQKLLKLLAYLRIFNIGDKISKVFNTLHFYRERKKILIGGYFLSFCSQIAIIFLNYLLARALGFNVSLGYFFLVVPVTFIFSLMPSINGLGVRDAGYVLILKPQGIIPSQALSLSFLATVIPILVSLSGGIFFLFYRSKGIEAPILSEEKL